MDRPKLYNRLSIRLTFFIVGILAVNFLIFAFLTLQGLRDDITSTLRGNLYNSTDVIRRSTRYSMLLNRKEDVHQIIRTVGSEEGVYRVRIYNKYGTIVFSSDTSEIDKTLPLDSDECKVCHSTDKPPTELSQREMTRYFTNERGEKVIGMINPIRNEADCSSGDCHAHAPQKQILGVLDVIMSTAKIDAIVEANTTRIQVSLALVALITALAGIFIIVLMVNKPLRAISAGIAHLSSGNLKYKIPLAARDELGVVARQFNKMSAELLKANSELHDWSNSLTQRVEEKNEELRKIYEQITQIEKLASLGKLSATVAHELNNPLAGILTYSKLIAKKIAKTDLPGKEDLLSHLQLISEESARCGRIVKDLLVFSHKGQDEMGEHGLAEVVDRCAVLIAHHLQLHNIEFIKDAPPGNLVAHCDPQKIEQALLAIMINGLEAMPDGGTLKVSLAREGSNAVIRVTDQGKGIAGANLPFIFEPFFSTKEAAKGTGLGLAVAYGIVQQHRGSLSVEKTSAAGTTFKIVLPMQE